MVGTMLVQLACDFLGYVLSPALSVVKGHDAARRFILPVEHVSDQGLAVNRVRVPDLANRAEILQHDIDVSTDSIGRDGGRDTHTNSYLGPIITDAKSVETTKLVG